MNDVQQYAEYLMTKAQLDLNIYDYNTLINTLKAYQIRVIDKATLYYIVFDMILSPPIHRKLHTEFENFLYLYIN